MIPVAAGVRIWIARGHTDMRKGMNGLALLVQEGLGRDPFAGDVFVFRARAGSLIKALWNDEIGLSLYAKRLDRGRFAIARQPRRQGHGLYAQALDRVHPIPWKQPHLPVQQRSRAWRARDRSGQRILGVLRLW